MNEVAIINYEMGNLKSINSACEKVGLKSLITDNSDIINKSKSLILPGVGAFNQAIKNIKRKNLYETIYKFYNSGRPIIGICLGMQILFKTGYEDGKSDGLNLINGYVDLIPIKNKKLPNIGWRKIQIGENKKFSSLKKFDKEKFYFVHSFMANVKDTKEVISFTNYGNIKIPAIVFNKNVIGIQFHPEKSRENGIELLKEIINIY